MNKESMKWKYPNSEEGYKNKCNDLRLEYVGNLNHKGKGKFIKFICPVHRNKGVQESDWYHFREYSKGCPYCIGRYRTTDEAKQMIKNKDVILLSEYKGFEKPIKCKCKRCGHEWVPLAGWVVTSGHGCPLCGSRYHTRKKSQKQFEEDLKKETPNIEIIGEYNGAHRLATFKCNICGNIWDTFPSNVLNHSSGCLMCNMSNGEKKMLNILDELNIKYKPQYAINDCRYIRKLRFDAFDIDNNIAFEYNGEQHYKVVDFTSKNPMIAEKQHDLCKKRDNAKHAYCVKHNIPLIIVPYWKKRKMKEFLIDEFKRLKLYDYA